MKARAILSWLVVASVAPAESVLERSKLRVFEAVSELLDDGDSEVRIAAGIALATLWEYADEEIPGSEYTISGMALCENPGTVSQAVTSLQRIGRNILLYKNISSITSLCVVTTPSDITPFFQTIKQIYF